MESAENAKAKLESTIAACRGHRYSFLGAVAVLLAAIVLFLRTNELANGISNWHDPDSPTSYLISSSKQFPGRDTSGSWGRFPSFYPALGWALQKRPQSSST